MLHVTVTSKRAAVQVQVATTGDECAKDLPQAGKGAVLDRLEAMNGYTEKKHEIDLPSL